MAWSTIAETSEFENKTTKTVMVENKPVIVSKLDDKFYAVDAVCTHMHGYLPAGKIEGACITCPVHHAQFDLKNGKMLKDVPGIMKMMGSSAKDLGAYELKVDGDLIKINR